MKYLRKFNESLSECDELKEFCRQNLAYLLDNGGMLTPTSLSSHSNSYCKIQIGCPIGVWDCFGKWENIKDDFIPFFELLNSKYDIVENSLIENGALNLVIGELIADNSLINDSIEHKEFTIKQIIEDDVDDDYYVLLIEFYIRTKYSAYL